jgi:hypothetical protein
MKKYLLILVFFSAALFTANAQVNSNAIGLRLGGGTVFGGEVSYQKGISAKNRIELDFGYNGSNSYNMLFVAGIFHWDFNIVEGLNWYIGPGAMAGLWTWNILDQNKSSIGFAVGGQVGLEYDFSSLDVPLLVSIDARPMWNFNSDWGGFGFGSALGVRYIF